MLMLWRIWHVRNGYIHEGKWKTVLSSVHFLKSYEETLLTCRLREEPSKPNGKGLAQPVTHSARTHRPSEHWEPPPVGWIKINVDGASDAAGRAGVGVIIRDERGHVLLTSWRAIFRCLDSEEIEALACKEGVELAAEWANKCYS